MSNPTHQPRSIDLNCDLGESDTPAQIAADAALLAIVTSANIACTGHAGNDASMARTIRAALIHNVAIGAHPSYPDRANFGRLEIDMPLAAIERSVAEQIATLARVARSLSATLSHVKPHGALYHAAMTKPPVAEAIARATGSIDPALTLVGLAGSPALDQWRALGFKVAAEAFADRRYEPDGSLRARSKPDALIENAVDAATQAVSIATGRGITSISGQHVPIHADTICLHSDTPNAPALAAAIRAALAQAGVCFPRISIDPGGAIFQTPPSIK